MNSNDQNWELLKQAYDEYREFENKEKIVVDQLKGIKKKKELQEKLLKSIAASRYTQEMLHKIVRFSKDILKEDDLDETNLIKIFGGRDLIDIGTVIVLMEREKEIDALISRVEEHNNAHQQENSVVKKLYSTFIKEEKK